MQLDGIELAFLYFNIHPIINNGRVWFQPIPLDISFYAPKRTWALVCCRRRQSESRKSATPTVAGSTSARPPRAPSPAVPSWSKRTTTRRSKGQTQCQTRVIYHQDHTIHDVAQLASMFFSSDHLILVKLHSRFHVFRLQHSRLPLLLHLLLNLSASHLNNHHLKSRWAKSTVLNSLCCCFVFFNVGVLSDQPWC